MRFRLSFSVDVGSTEMGGSVFMNDWAKQTASELRARDEQRAENNATERQHEKLRNEQGPVLWENVQRYVQTKCEELNTDYGRTIGRAILTLVPTSPSD